MAKGAKSHGLCAPIYVIQCNMKGCQEKTNKTMVQVLLFVIHFCLVTKERKSHNSGETSTNSHTGSCQIPVQPAMKNLAEKKKQRNVKSYLTSSLATRNK